MKKSALITGIGGQDGSYLAELLLEKGYEVHGLMRTSEPHALENIRGLLDSIHLHIGSADNQVLITKLIAELKPDECYHLAATSFVSYDLAAETSIIENNFNSTHYLLASIKAFCPECRFYFAGSSEMFGEALSAPQNEMSHFLPRSIYGISKMAGAMLSRNYRRQHGLFTCNGILYNHESPRRSVEFVTRKISASVAKIHCGLQHEMELGNLEARRDWGYAPEYVQAMYQMLNQHEPDDYVIATNQLHSVKDLVECAFSCVNLDYQNHVKINPMYHRYQEEIPLVGDYAKAKTVLGFEPQKKIYQIIEEMIQADIQRIQKC